MSENISPDLLAQVAEIYGPEMVARHLDCISPWIWTPELVRQCIEGIRSLPLSDAEYVQLQSLLPEAPPPDTRYDFDFIDLFAGIGGMRRGFEQAGGRCVFTSERDPAAIRTYRANYYSDKSVHRFNEDIRDLSFSNREYVTEEEAWRHIDGVVPDHDVLLAGLPFAPPSATEGTVQESDWEHTLFFDVARIIAAKRPVAFVIESVRNLALLDRGRSLNVMLAVLDELGYQVADAAADTGADPKILNAVHFVPQHRERTVLVGFRSDLGVHRGFSLGNISHMYPDIRPKLGDILDGDVDQRYILPARLWEYLLGQALTHKAEGAGYGLVGPDGVTRPLSARYYRDCSAILVDRGLDPAAGPHDLQNMKNRPRRLTPRECVRLMGFDRPGESGFRIPVPDSDAYRLLGNASVAPVFAAVAQLMKARVVAGRRLSAAFRSEM